MFRSCTQEALIGQCHHTHPALIPDRIGDSALQMCCQGNPGGDDSPVKVFIWKVLREEHPSADAAFAQEVFRHKGPALYIQLLCS